MRRKAARPLSQLLADRFIWPAAAIVGMVGVAALLAPLVAPADPLANHLEGRLTPPFTSLSYYGILGTDQLGRDELSRLIYAARVSLVLGFAGAFVSGSFGVTLGLLAGYLRGTVDDLVMRAVDVFMSIPTLLLGLIVLYVLGPGFANMLIFFAIARWMLFCRITRAAVLTVREQGYVESARAVGCTGARVMLRHVLPNVTTPIAVVASMEVARNILLESTLSFLGMGVQPPESSWGLMLAQGRSYIINAWWVVTFPGLAILCVTASVNLIGTSVREMMDPILRSPQT